MIMTNNQIELPGSARISIYGQDGNLLIEAVVGGLSIQTYGNRMPLLEGRSEVRVTTEIVLLQQQANPLCENLMFGAHKLVIHPHNVTIEHAHLVSFDISVYGDFCGLTLEWKSFNQQVEDVSHTIFTVPVHNIEGDWYGWDNEKRKSEQPDWRQVGF